MQRIPEIHLWCNTCWLYRGQHGSRSRSLHACSRGRMPGFDRETSGTVSRCAIHSATISHFVTVKTVKMFVLVFSISVNEPHTKGLKANSLSLFSLWTDLYLTICPLTVCLCTLWSYNPQSTSVLIPRICLYPSVVFLFPGTVCISWSGVPLFKAKCLDLLVLLVYSLVVLLLYSLVTLLYPLVPLLYPLVPLLYPLVPLLYP